MFEDRIEGFLAACEGDAALQEYARKHTISIHFVINDQNMEFTVFFKGGSVQAEMGPRTHEGDLKVKMNAETLEELLSGRLNGASAFMSGRLKFIGDPMKGMALQKITKEMVRLWNKTTAGNASTPPVGREPA
jgi:putative sterol carrier protein